MALALSAADVCRRQGRGYGGGPYVQRPHLHNKTLIEFSAPNGAVAQRGPGVVVWMALEGGGHTPGSQWALKRGDIVRMDGAPIHIKSCEAIAHFR